MKILQVNQPVTSSQPQVGNVKIYSGAPIPPYEGGARHTRQPPDTKYKIYSSKPLPVVLVRLIGAGDETLTINESDFDSEIHEKIK